MPITFVLRTKVLLCSGVKSKYFLLDSSKSKCFNEEKEGSDNIGDSQCSTD